MIKLSASVSKKVPVPEVEFSSQNYSAGMEVEASCDASEQAVRDRLRSLYGLLEEAIEEQIEGRAPRVPEDRPRPPQQRRNGPGNGGGNGSSRSSTEAQQKAIHAIARSQGYSRQRLGGLISESFGVDSVSDLSIGEASSLIDTLKNNGKE